MRKIIGLLFFGIFLTGCYANSLTMVGPATGVASGKLSETATSTTIARCTVSTRVATGL